MSADNGYMIRKNSDHKYVLQHYFASDGAPPIEEATHIFDTLKAAVVAYERLESESDWATEYGLTVLNF